MMALDNGAVEFNKPVVCVGGSAWCGHRGIYHAAYTADCLDTKIHEILYQAGFVLNYKAMTKALRLKFGAELFVVFILSFCRAFLGGSPVQRRLWGAGG